MFKPYFAVLATTIALIISKSVFAGTPCPLSLEDLRAKSFEAGSFRFLEDVQLFQSDALVNKLLIISEFALPDRLRQTTRDKTGITNQYIIIGDKTWKAGQKGKWIKAESRIGAGFMALLPFYPSNDVKDLSCVDSPSGKSLDWSWSVESRGLIDHYTVETDKQTMLTVAVKWEHHIDKDRYTISESILNYDPKIKIEAPKP